MDKNTLLNNISEKQKGYDYSLVKDIFGYDEKIQIICHEKDELGREHGVFESNYTHFIKRGDCCPKCRGKYMDKDLFIYKCEEIHGKGKYCYDNFVFQNKNSKSIIHCNEHNIDFEQQAKKHLMGHGCPICRYENSGKHQRNDPSFFEEKARKIWGNKYDYSETEFVKYTDKVKIICHEKDENGIEHGAFYMLPGNHLHMTSPQGCPKCAKSITSKKKEYTVEKFEELAKIRHENKYKYFQDYINSQTKVKIECPKHGIFEMTPTNHLYGQGCPTCGLVWTRPEREILSFLQGFIKDEEILIHKRDIIAPYELDIYIPSYKIAIEYNGLIWHSEKFKEDYKNVHLKKLERCQKEGIRLIQIFEDEWQEKKEIVKSRIKSIFKIYSKIVYARKCTIAEVPYQDALKFLDSNHLQGKCHSQKQYGLVLDNELIAVMTFGRTRQMKKYNEDYDNTWELLRFATKQNIAIIGGASRLLAHFIKNNSPHEIISYADKRWSVGDLYYNLGFEHTHDSKPNYFYVVGKRRENRFKYRKANLIKMGFNKEKSEHKIMKEQNIYRIYDCGTMVFKKYII